MPLPPPHAGVSVLDQPPPSPALAGMGQPGSSSALPGMSAMGPGAPGGPGGGAGSALPGPMAGGGMPSGASGTLPPEILTGVMGVGKQISTLLDGLIQVTPELGPDWQAVQQLLMQTLSKLVVAGAQPVTPTSPGLGAFPGGGIDQGQRPSPGLPSAPGLS